MPPRFQRARSAEEKEIRRAAILKAARKLLSEVGSLELGLNELARRSGVSKPNIYRYFESREEVLLQVLVEEIAGLTADLETRFAQVRRNDVRAVVKAIVDAFESRPQLCELMSIAALVLERNLSEKAIVTAKMAMKTLTLRIAALLHGRLPAIPLEQCAWSAATAATWVSGIWPSVNPGTNACAALAHPELQDFKPAFVRDFTRFLTVMFRGLASG